MVDVSRTGKRFLIFAVLATITVGSAMAQSPSMADRHYVRTAIETNNAEIAAARLALRRSNSSDVKQFANRMIHDHTMLNEQMEPIAVKLDVEVSPGEVTPQQQQVADQLKNLTGGAFDQQYLAAMVSGHEQAVQETKTEISGSQFPLVKDAAQKALPVIEKHLQRAQQLAQSHHVQVGAS